MIQGCQSRIVSIFNSVECSSIPDDRVATISDVLGESAKYQFQVGFAARTTISTREGEVFGSASTDVLEEFNCLIGNDVSICINQVASIIVAETNISVNKLIPIVIGGSTRPLSSSGSIISAIEVGKEDCSYITMENTILGSKRCIVTGRGRYSKLINITKQVITDDKTLGRTIIIRIGVGCVLSTINKQFRYTAFLRNCNVIPNIVGEGCAEVRNNYGCTSSESEFSTIVRDFKIRCLCVCTTISQVPNYASTAICSYICPAYIALNGPISSTKTKFFGRCYRNCIASSIKIEGRRTELLLSCRKFCITIEVDCVKQSCCTSLLTKIEPLSTIVCTNNLESSVGRANNLTSSNKVTLLTIERKFVYTYFFICQEVTCLTTKHNLEVAKSFTNLKSTTIQSCRIICEIGVSYNLIARELIVEWYGKVINCTNLNLRT